MLKDGKKVFNFGFGQSPFPIPEKIVSVLRDTAHKKDYLPMQGLPELREAISKYLLKRTGVDFKKENIIITPGSKEAMLLMHVVFNGEIILPAPSWVSYEPQAEIANNKVEVVDELPTGKMALNGDEIISTESSFFKERKKMLFNGLISINFIFSETGDLQELPRIKFLSVINNIEKDELLYFSEYLNDEIKGFIPFNKSKESKLREFLNKKIKKFINNRYDKKPSIILDIIYI